MKKNKPKIIKQLENLNNVFKVKIRYRKNPSSLYSLYLDYWDGSKRQTRNLKLYISGKSKDIIKDKNIVMLAQTIRNKKETQLLESSTGISLSSITKAVNFIDFFKTFSNTKKDSNYRISHDHFKKSTKMISLILER